MKNRNSWLLKNSVLRNQKSQYKWSRQLLNRWKGSVVFKACANWENATEAFGLTLTSSAGTGKKRSPSRTWNQPTCQADSDSLGALCFDQMINRVKATAQRCSVLALAHRAAPSPGSICSQLLKLKGRQEDYSWSIRRAIQMLLTLQTLFLGNAKCATILTTQSKERGKKI